MKKKLDIPKDFWKDFKDQKDFDDFFSDLFKEGINQMLKAEMTDHLGYEKHSKEGDNSGNSRNGDYTKTLKTNLGEVNVPRDRNGEFDPKVVPKHESRLEKSKKFLAFYSISFPVRLPDENAYKIFNTWFSFSIKN